MDVQTLLCNYIDLYIKVKLICTLEVSDGEEHEHILDISLSIWATIHPPLVIVSIPGVYWYHPIPFIPFHQLV